MQSMAYGYTAGGVSAMPKHSSLVKNPNVTGPVAVAIWMARAVTIATVLRFDGWTGQLRDRDS